MRHIKDIKDGERVIDHYLVRRKETRESRAGKAFLSLRLSDKTGEIDAKVWELTSNIQPFEEGDVVKVDGIVAVYQNDLQMKISKLRRSSEGEFVPADYVPISARDVNEMHTKLVAIVEGVKNPFVKKLLENIFINNGELVEMLKRHQAAMHMHHGYVGGLLEHTLSVAEISLFLGERYHYVNVDLLTAGALLHDIGKLYELRPLPHNEYTDDGQMLGHIIIGVEMVTAEVAKIQDFPSEAASLIKHLIVSHHGEFEFGSPKLPATPEAMLLHFADNIDAKLTTFSEAYQKDKSQGKWLGYQKALGRYIRKPVEL